MVQHGHGLLLGKFAAVQGGPFALREAVLATPTSQDTGGFAGAIAEANAQVFQASVTVIFTLGVLAAEGFQVVHSSFGLPMRTKKLPCSCIYPIKQLRRRQA